MLQEMFGKRLKFFRSARGMTQEQLAEKLGITKVHLGRVERGESSASLKLISNLCRELKISPASLFLLSEFDENRHEKIESDSLHSESGIWTINLKNRAENWSSSISSILGYTCLLSPSLNTFLERVLQDYRQVFKDFYQQLCAEVEPDVLTVWIARKDGHERCLQAHAHLLCEGSGEPACACIIIHDISDWLEIQKEMFFSQREYESIIREKTGSLIRAVDEAGQELKLRRQTEEALHKKQQLFQAMFKESLVIKLIVDPENLAVIDANPAAADFFGYSRQQLKNMKINKINISPIEHIHAALLETINERRSFFEVRHRLASGEIRDTEVYASPLEIEGKILIHAIIHDITDRKKALDDLHQSSTQFLSAFDHAPIGMILVGLDGSTLNINNAICEMLGYPANEMMFMTFKDLTHPDDLEEDVACFNQLLSGEISTYSMEKRYMHKSGRVIWGLLKVSLVRNKNGDPLHFISQVVDITRRVNAEEALRKCESTFEAVAAHMSDFDISVEHSGKCMWFNPAAQNLKKYSSEQIHSMPGFLGIILRKEDLKLNIDEGSIRELELRCISKDGTERCLCLSQQPANDGDDALSTSTSGTIIAEKKISISKNKKEDTQNNKYLLQNFSRKKYFYSIIGKSRQMQHVYSDLQKIASLDKTVLITGDTGTGKRLIAETLHALGPCSKGPFIRLSCLISEDKMFESELFGHTRCPFTGIYSSKTGAVEAAGGGTLFLDEIGEIASCSQLKLLQFLKDFEYTLPGDSSIRKANLRVIAATNADLAQKVMQGSFCKDLYDRLNNITIHVPRLNERSEDIPQLIHHFLKHFTNKHNKAIKGISAGAMHALLNYSWPGNVLELEGCMECVVLLCNQDMIEPEHLSVEIMKCQTDQAHGFGKLDRIWPKPWK